LGKPMGCTERTQNSATLPRDYGIEIAEPVMMTTNAVTMNCNAAFAMQVAYSPNMI
jgi:hypothetical protein